MDPFNMWYFRPSSSFRKPSKPLKLKTYSAITRTKKVDRQAERERGDKDDTADRATNREAGAAAKTKLEVFINQDNNKKKRKKKTNNSVNLWETENRSW